jgi:two-component system chemotaxis response regulator CheY
MRILIVDQEHSDPNGLRELLSSFGSCDVVRDEHEALNAFHEAWEENSPYRLVVLHPVMADFARRQLLHGIQQTERQRGADDSQKAKVLIAYGPAGQHTPRDSASCPIDERWLLNQVRAMSAGIPDADASSQAGEKRRRFLIVDDEPVCRELLAETLHPYADCDVAREGASAIESFRLALESGRPYDLVCLDVMMPGLSGHQVLEQMRQLEKEHGILGLDGAKVIMTTALADSKKCVEAFRYGCEGYVIKPFSEVDIVAAIERIEGSLSLQ